MPRSDTAAHGSTVDAIRLLMAANENDLPSDAEEEVRDLGEDLTGDRAREAFSRLVTPADKPVLRLTGERLRRIDAYGGAVAGLSLLPHVADAERTAIVHRPALAAPRTLLNDFLTPLPDRVTWAGAQPLDSGVDVIIPVSPLPNPGVAALLVETLRAGSQVAGNAFSGLLSAAVLWFCVLAGVERGGGAVTVLACGMHTSREALQVVVAQTDPSGNGRVGLAHDDTIAKMCDALGHPRSGVRHEIHIASGRDVLTYRSAGWQRSMTSMAPLPGLIAGVEVALDPSTL
jgi:hypothetical protein